ncbi:MAG: hypothetical protein IPM32_11995 [Ignavibacteriae bacterium]|nr:hypothetical protein [Ignavibacteriota bacterium]
MKIINQELVENNLFVLKFDQSEIEIDKEKIADEIGYANGILPENIDDLLNQIIMESKSRIHIEAGYKIGELKQYSKNILFDNTEFNVDKIIFNQFLEANNAAIFVCTIGNEMELWSKKNTAEGDLLRGYLIDVTASTIVENVADLLHDFIGKTFIEKDWKITNRYSPGYCNWQVNEQQNLFSLLPKNFCNIKLSDSSLMNPIKSISGIIGIGKNVKYREYFCERCGIKDCTQRVYLQRKKKSKI